MKETLQKVAIRSLSKTKDRLHKTDIKGFWWGLAAGMEVELIRKKKKLHLFGIYRRGTEEALWLYWSEVGVLLSENDNDYNLHFE